MGSNKKMYALSVEDVMKWGLKVEDIAKCFMKFDELNYQKSWVWEEKYWISVLNNNLCWFTVLATEDREIVGYTQYASLNEKTFQLAMSGQFDEKDINDSCVVPLNNPGEYYIYISDFTIRPQYSSTKALFLLFDYFFNQVILLAQSGMYVNQWCSYAATGKGVALSKLGCMNYICKNMKEGDVYGGDFFSVNKLFKRYPLLIKLYQEHRNISEAMQSTHRTVICG